MKLVRLEPRAPRSRVKHSTTEPLGSHCMCCYTESPYIMLGLLCVRTVSKDYQHKTSRLKQVESSRKNIFYSINSADMKKPTKYSLIELSQSEFLEQWPQVKLMV